MTGWSVLTAGDWVGYSDSDRVECSDGSDWMECSDGGGLDGVF